MEFDVTLYHRPGRGVDNPPPSSTKVVERVQIYLYSLSGPSWPVLGEVLPFYLTHTQIRLTTIGVQTSFTEYQYFK